MLLLQARQSFFGDQAGAGTVTVIIYLPAAVSRALLRLRQPDHATRSLVLPSLGRRLADTILQRTAVQLEEHLNGNFLENLRVCLVVKAFAAVSAEDKEVLCDLMAQMPLEFIAHAGLSEPTWWLWAFPKDPEMMWWEVSIPTEQNYICEVIPSFRYPWQLQGTRNAG